MPTELTGLSAPEQAAEAQPDAPRAHAAAQARRHRVVIDDQSTSSVTRVANPDGSVTAIAYERPLFIRQPGRRARLDARLSSASAANRDEVASGRALKDGLSVKRTVAHGATWTIGGAVVSMAVVSAAGDARGELGADGAVRYREAQQDSDLLVRSSESGPSLDLLLKDAAASPTMRLRVTDPSNALGGLGGATPFGGWRFGGSTDTRYLGLAPPFAYEQATGQSLPPTPGSAHLQVQQERPGVYLVTETVDPDWLKGKDYPIVLDPAFTDRDESQLNDCQIYSGAYQYTNWCPGGMDYVRAWSGYLGSDNQKFVARALLHPNVDQLTSDGGGTYLQDAYFGFYMANSTGNNLHDVCAGGTFWGTGSNTTWANTAGGAPLDGNGGPRYCSSFWASTGQWGYPNVTDILRNSKNGSFPYYGFVLRDNDEVNYTQQSNFDGGASPNPAAHPFFAVTYAVTTQPPTNVTTQAANNGSTGTSTVTAAWSYPADNGGADLSYQTAYYAYLYTCDAGYVGESGWLNRDTRTWQWNGLDPQQCYKAYVRAGNPAGVSGYGTGTSAFGYPQRPGLAISTGYARISGTISYPQRAGPCQQCAGDGGHPLDQYLVRFYAVGQHWPNGSPVYGDLLVTPNFGASSSFEVSGVHPLANGWYPTSGTTYAVDVFPHTPTGTSYTDPATGAVGAPGYGLIASYDGATPAACTDVTADSVTQLAGGALLYNYTVGGSTITEAKPPSGWSPVTATDSELALYQFPPRPAIGLDSVEWTSLWSHWQSNAIGLCVSSDLSTRASPMVAQDSTVPSDYSASGASGGSAGTATFYNYSGLSLPSSAGSNYTAASGTWAVTGYRDPSSGGVSPFRTHTSWVGLGGMGGGGLLQAGIVTASDRPTDTIPYYEAINNKTGAAARDTGVVKARAGSYRVNPGDSVNSQVRYDVSSGRTTFSVLDTSTGSAFMPMAMTYAPADYYQGVPEFIDERLTVAGNYTPLREYYYHTVGWSDARAQVDNEATYTFGLRRSTKLLMAARTTGQQLAGMTYGKNVFTDTWLNPGPSETP